MKIKRDYWDFEGYIQVREKHKIITNYEILKDLNDWWFYPKFGLELNKPHLHYIFI